MDRRQPENRTVRALPRSEWLTAGGLILVLLVLKWADIFDYRYDSDEMQHLHVVWGWTHGLVQYRDLFDNHMPLFHLAFAPVLGWIGAHSMTVTWMRAAQFPIFLLGAWATFRIGALLFNRRVGLWAMILAAFWGDIFFYSIEFRPDNLWALCWLLSLLELLQGRLSPGRALRAGLIFGLAVGVSLKSGLLLANLILAALLTLGFWALDHRGWWRRVWTCGAAFGFGALLVPGTIGIAFATAGDWSRFYYCVWLHNLLPHFHADHRQAWWNLIFPFALPLLAALGWRLFRGRNDPRLAWRRVLVLLVAGLSWASLYGFWVPMRQDFLPILPLVFVFVSAGLCAALDHAERSIGRSLRVAVPLLLGLAEISYLLAVRPPTQDQTLRQREALRAVLQLTSPNDYVFDCKGETVFRRRCVYKVMEAMTMERIERGLMSDRVAPRCEKTHTCLAVVDGRLPLDATRFLWQNYLHLPCGVRVAGFRLPRPLSGSGTIDFQVNIPAPYEIVSPAGAVPGVLDGTPNRGARLLAAGSHTFFPARAEEPLALVWSRAAERGYNPFAPIPAKANSRLRTGDFRVGFSRRG